MFNGGLSELLAEALDRIAKSFPKLLSSIQTHLLDSISFTLTNKPFRETSRPSASAAQATAAAAAAAPIGRRRNSLGGVNPSAVALALRILGSFDFSGHWLADFLRDNVIPYMEDANPYARARHHCSDRRRLSVEWFAVVLIGWLVGRV
jgi:serine/threonine-protein kinase mTOR